MDLQAFLSDNYARACRYVQSYVTDKAAAEDIVSEGMLVFWRKRDSVREDAAQAFLFTILRNKALDYLRKERTHRRISLSMDEAQLRDLDLRISSLDENTPEKVFSTELTRVIRESIDALPERTRDIFKSHRFGEKTYGEIARLYGISEKGVEYHICKALQTLRKSLKDYLSVWLLFFG